VKKYAILIVALIGALMMIPGLVNLINTAVNWNFLLVILAILYILTIALGITGALLSPGKVETAAKVLAGATFAGIFLVAVNLYLLLSLEGTFLNYTAMGLLFLAIATGLTSKKNKPERLK
jgi:hypothetical protein